MAAVLVFVVVVAVGIGAMTALDWWRQRQFNRLPPYRARNVMWVADLPKDDGLPLWAKRPGPQRPPPFDWQTEDGAP